MVGGVSILVGLLAAPTASSVGLVSSANPVRIVPPYHSVRVVPEVTTNYGGCAASSVTHAPSFDSHTGTARMANVGEARTCSASANSFGGSATSVMITLPLRVTAGTTAVGVHWSPSFDGMVAIHHSDCTVSSTRTFSECGVSAAVNVFVSSYLLDGTTGRTFTGTGGIPEFLLSTNWFLSCDGGSCTAGGSGNSGSFAESFHATIWIHTGGLDPAHRYSLVSEVFAATDAGAARDGRAVMTGSGLAEIAIGAPGSGAVLNWVEIR